MPPVKDLKTGQFVRQENDMPISSVLSDEAGKRAKKEADDKAREDANPDKGKPKDGLDEAAEQVLDDFIGVDRKKDKSNAESAKKEKDDKAKSDREKARQARDDKEKEQRKTDDKARDVATIDDDKLERIASAAAEGAARAFKPKEEKKAETEKPTGPEAKRLAVLERMGKLQPALYPDPVKRYKEGQAKIEAYRKNWEKDHPGETFDEESPEHEDYYEKNGLYEFWDQDDYLDALADIRFEQNSKSKNEEANRELNAKLTVLERKEKLRESEAEIGKEQFGAAENFWASLGDDYADVCTEDGHVNHNRLKELRDADPVGFPYRMSAANDLNEEVKVIYSLMNGLVDYNPKDEIHVAMGKFGEQVQKELMDKPADKRRNADGLQYMPGKDYWALPKDKREKYWTLSAKDLAVRRAKVLAKETAQRIKTDEERLEKFAAARGYKKPTSENGDHEEHEDNPEINSGQRGQKPRSPSSSSESLLAARQAGAKNASQKKEGAFFSDTF